MKSFIENNTNLPNTKYLYIREYSLDNKLYIPEKLNNEYDTIVNGNLIRSKIVESYKDIDQAKDSVFSSCDSIYDYYKLSDDLIELDDTVIYDVLSINDMQKLAYVLECPICLTKIITSNKDINICPRCENSEFSFNLLALINVDQVKQIDGDLLESEK